MDGWMELSRTLCAHLVRVLLLVQQAVALGCRTLFTWTLFAGLSNQRSPECVCACVLEQEAER